MFEVKVDEKVEVLSFLMKKTDKPFLYVPGGDKKAGKVEKPAGADYLIPLKAGTLEYRVLERQHKGEDKGEDGTDVDYIPFKVVAKDEGGETPPPSGDLPTDKPLSKVKNYGNKSTKPL